MKGEELSDSLHYLLLRQTMASDWILLHPLLFFPALRNYHNGKYVLVSYCFQKPSFGKLNYSFHYFTSHSTFDLTLFTNADHNGE